MSEAYEKSSLEQLKSLLDDSGYKIIEPGADEIANLANQRYFGLVGSDTLTTEPREWSPYSASPTLYPLAGDEFFVKRIEVVPGGQDEQNEYDEFVKGLGDPQHPNHRYLRQACKRCVLAFDLADFTEGSAMGGQLLILSALKVAVNKVADSRVRDAVENYLPTGDGFIAVFLRAEQACKFAIGLTREIEGFNAASLNRQIHFRIGMDFGEVEFFKDLRGNWNYVGDAINNACRVLSTIGPDMDDVIYVSYDVFAELGNQYKKLLIPMGRRRAKHGKMYRVFHLNHHLCGEAGHGG